MTDGSTAHNAKDASRYERARQSSSPGDIRAKKFPVQATHVGLLERKATGEEKMSEAERGQPAACSRGSQLVGGF